MNAAIALIFLSLCMGAIGLCIFLWTLGSGQYDDLAGDAERILHDPDRDHDANGPS